MNIEFKTYDDFLSEYKRYHMDKCNNCNGIREIVEDEVTVKIEDRFLYYAELLVFECAKCGAKCLSMHSKRMIDGCYKSMVEENQLEGNFIRKEYRKKFDYCQRQDFSYDYRDYYSIPGLCYDEEHSVEGFLTPVYFDRKALIYFISVPDFEVDIFSETYGHIGKKDPESIYQYEWAVPFGFNSHGKLVFWLGDLNDMDDQSQAILKSFNIDSDHLITNSEFFQAQMNCIFSEPIRENQILINKDNFISNIKKKYGIDLTHLDEECVSHAKNVKRPIIFTEQSVSGVINAFDKILVEGFNVEQLRLLYEALYIETERKKEYKKWQSIRLLKEVLKKFCDGMEKNIDIEILISPLYILHDYRIYLDHLLSKDKQETTKAHILSTLGIQNFKQQEKIYSEEIERLNKLFQYFVLLSK